MAYKDACILKFKYANKFFFIEDFSYFNLFFYDWLCTGRDGPSISIYGFGLLLPSACAGSQSGLSHVCILYQCDDLILQQAEDRLGLSQIGSLSCFYFLSKGSE